MTAGWPVSPGEPWRVAGVAVAGLRHVLKEQPCQDAFGWTVLPSGVLLVTLADGAGSAEHSEAGAQIAVNVALASLAQGFTNPPLLTDDELKAGFLRAVEASKMAVAQAATNAAHPVKSYSSTLLLCAISDAWAAALQIGDGAVLLQDAADEWKALTRPCVDEYLNETVFLQSETALDKAQFAIVRNRAKQLAVFSDGLQLLALKMPEAAPHAPFLTPLFKFLRACDDASEAREQLECFLRSPRVTQRTDDDLSLVLAVRNVS